MWAEIRDRKWLRIIFGVLCMLLLVSQIYHAMNLADLEVSLHSMCLDKINVGLKSDQTELVRTAVQGYEDNYTRTGGDSLKAALRTLHHLEDTF